jgi:hypothetical protein
MEVKNMEKNIKRMLFVVVALLLMGIFTVLQPYEVSLQHLQILAVWNLFLNMVLVFYLIIKE